MLGKYKPLILKLQKTKNTAVNVKPIATLLFDIF